MTATSTEGLPESPEPYITDGNDMTAPELGRGCTGYTARQMLAYGRRCYGAGVANLKNASPAEGRQGEEVARQDARLFGRGFTVDGVRVDPSRVTMIDDETFIVQPSPADSPATFVEVEALADRLDNAYRTEYHNWDDIKDAASLLRTLAKKTEGRAVVDLGETGCLHGATVEGDVTVRANHSWQVHGCLFRGSTTPAAEQGEPLSSVATVYDAMGDRT